MVAINFSKQHCRSTGMNIYNEIQEAKKKEAFTELNDKIMIS